MWGGYGFYNVHMDYIIDGDQRDYEFHHTDNGTPDFELGVLNSSIVIENLYMKMFDDLEGGRCLNDAQIEYRIDGGSVQNYGYGSWFITDKNGSNYELQKVGINFTIADAANFTPGDHTIEFWFKAWGNGDHFLSNNGQNYKFTFTIPYTVNVTPDGYATFYSGSTAVELPEGAIAYAGELSGNTLNLTSINLDGVIPAGTAVVLKAPAGVTKLALKQTESTATFSGTNDLQGTDAVIATNSVEGTVMVLGYEKGVAGFYRYTGANLGANKAYLVVPAANAPIRIVEATTAVESAEANEAVKFFENGTIYIRKNGAVYTATGMLVK